MYNFGQRMIGSEMELELSTGAIVIGKVLASSSDVICVETDDRKIHYINPDHVIWASEWKQGDRT